MRWLNKVKPLDIYQGSNIPYVILEDGLKLCYHNQYFTCPDQNDYNLHFTINKKDAKKISASVYKLNKFPAIIPFSDIISLNDIILDGQYIKMASKKDSEYMKIAIIKNTFLEKTDDLEDLIDNLNDFKRVFLIHGDKISNKARLLDGMFTLINHGKSWGRVCVSIADELCLRDKEDRKYCWTRDVPNLEISCFGFKDSEEMNKFHDGLNEIGVINDTTWEN